MSRDRRRQRGSSGGRGGATLGGSRGETVRVKTAAKRRPSSTRWLERQLNDPYVAEAKRLGYRSRAAFKLLQLDERFHVLTKGKRVVDLGAAPGGWTQVAVERVRSQEPGGGRVVAIDLQEIEPIAGAVLSCTWTAPRRRPPRGRSRSWAAAPMWCSATWRRRRRAISRPTISGSWALPNWPIETARELLEPGGAFIVKVWQGGAQKELLDALKREFDTVRHVKPPASRSDSAELYLVALGFRGRRGN